MKDIGPIIVLKARQRKALMNIMSEHQDLIEQLRAASEPDEIKTLVDLIEDINVTTEPEYLGFKDEGEAQSDYWFISSYQDEVVANEGASFRFFFCCDSGPEGDKCQTVTTSKGWRRKHEVQGWVKGQHYYCKSCHAGYKQSAIEIAAGSEGLLHEGADPR